MTRFVRLPDQKQLEAVGAFYSPSRRYFTSTAIGAFHAVFTKLHPERLKRHSVCGRPATTPVAMDGKAIHGAAKQTEGGSRMMVAALEHDTGLVLGQVSTDRKSNEIPAVRDLSGKIDLTGYRLCIHCRQE